MPFIEAKIKSLGTAACPPYHLALVIGGTSAEVNLKTVKLASAKYLDNMYTSAGSRSVEYVSAYYYLLWTLESCIIIYG